jgi:mannosyl-3-phosphoglycerate phosphatase
MPLLVFTDLDGTFLSHTDYSWEAARPALERLIAIGAGIVMASSKTAPEIEVLRRQTGLAAFPAIVENGAGLLEPDAQAAVDPAEYRKLRTVLDRTPAQLRAHFTGFGDMDVARIADVTGLAPGAAVLAAQRAFSEPGIWSGTESEKGAFLAALADQGLSAREGGRFLTLSTGQTKADRMAQITGRYTPRHTVALGDAPNDVEMLETADFGIVIANPQRSPLPPLDGETTGRITRSARAGPDGWNDTLLDLIKRLNL